MKEIPLARLKISPFLRDFIEGAEPVHHLFNNHTVDREFCAKRSQHGASRSRLQTLFSNGLRGTTISDAQQAHLNLVLNPQSVVVCGGQQLGMFGGPLYTLLKIGSVAAEAKHLSDRLGLPVLPVFWLEDVDHDAAEASDVWTTDDEGIAVKKRIWDGMDPRLPQYKRRFTAEEVKVIHSLAPTIQGRHSQEVQDLIREMYTEGRLWNDTFMSLLEPFLQAWGILVVRASDVLMYGMHAPICIRDVEQSGELANAIMQVTQKIEGLGYSRQAEVHPLQFLLDAGNGRNKIEVTESGYSAGGIEYTHKQLLELSRFHPEQFSPGVLARPLVQDAILPTVASVLGGAEIAYHAQLFHAYQWLGIEQPVPLLRHSACVLDGRTERFLNKLNTEPSAFFRTLEEVESEFTSQLLTTVLPEENHTNESISSLLSPFSKAAEQIDPTLLKTVAAAATSIQQQTDGVRAKLKSAIKKSNSVLLDRVRAVWWTLFPDNTLQERVYPLLWHVAKHGTDGVRIIVETSCNVHRGNVAIVHILPEDQTGDQ